MLKKNLLNTIFFSLIILFPLALLAGAPTLKTININGNMQDWSEVLTNPNNVTLDGASASNCAYSTDRDCEVQSTGRDMVKFAWTYDSENIYLYVERVGNSSNIQNFFFIMDVGQDKSANSSDFVLHVSYQGSNRNTDLTLYRYSPLNPSGDSLVDSNGFADGYNMPGSLSSIPSDDPSYFVVSGITGGDTTGVAFETYVPWQKLLVSSGTPIFFHVASGNNASLSQVDDNLGGPGGGIGAFAYYWVQIYPDNLNSVTQGQNITYYHTVKNNGSFDDIIDLYSLSSNNLAISFYLGSVCLATDSNGDGDFLDSGDYINSLYDVNSNNLPDLQLNAWTTQDISVVIGTSILSQNSYDLTHIYGVSNGDSSYAYCKDETYIGDLLLYPDNSISGTPSEYVNLHHTVANYRADDYIKFFVSSSSGFSVYLYLGSDLLAIDNDGNCVWDYVNGSFDSNSDGFPDLFLANGSSYELLLYVPIPSGAVIGSTESIILSANGHSNGGATSATDLISIKKPFELSPSYSFSDSTEKYGASGNSVYFSHKIRNNSSTPTRFTFYASGFEPYNESLWNITIYSDPNGDGNPSDGSQITYTDSIPEMGGEYNIVVQIDVPSSVSPPATSNSAITAVKCLNSDCSSYDTNISESAQDDLKVSYIVPFSDANFTLSETHFAPCETLYSKAFNVVPDQVNRYSVKIIDSASNTIRDVSKSSDVSESFTDLYSFPSNSPAGNYKLQLLDSGSLLDESDIYLEKSGSIQISLSPLGKKISDSLTINYQISNNSNYSNYEGTKIYFTVKNASGTLYLKEDGSWATYENGLYSKLVNSLNVDSLQNLASSTGFSSVTYPSYGQYSVCANWEFSCGDISNLNDDISNTCINFYVVSLESYYDSGRTTIKNAFSTAQTAYFLGEGYLASTNYNLAIYNQIGERILFTSKLSESDGKLLYEIASSSLGEGNYKIVVFPSDVTPPSSYIPDYQYQLSLDEFTVFQIALLRYGGVTSLNPLTPEAPEIFIYYPSDPSLSLERDLESSNFVSGSSFPHETTDLSETPLLIFYQIYGVSGDSLRVSKDNGKITITY